jgi:hypothetical protein
MVSKARSSPRARGWYNPVSDPRAPAGSSMWINNGVTVKSKGKHKHLTRAKTKLALRVKGYMEIPDKFKYEYHKPGSMKS